MRQYPPCKNKAASICKALATARTTGEPVLVGQPPENIRLVCFDMDGTLIKMETINRIAEVAGIGEQMQELTSKAMNGEVDFKSNFLQRVKMLQGVPVEILEDIASELPYTNGLKNLMQELQRHSIQTAVITGNFNIFGKYLKQKFGFDHIFTTVPEIKNGILTGNICGDIIDAPAKSSILIKICSENNIPLNCTLSIGDGANDIPLLATAGAAIAYNAITAKRGIDEIILPLIR